MTNDALKTVLIVDDQASWRMLLQESLGETFAVKTAANYAAAIGLLEAEQPPFHVAVVDIRLEDRDPANEEGLSLVRKIQEQGVYTKTIVVTGYPSIRTAREALGRLNAYEYMEKNPEGGGGFDPDHFLAVVERAAAEAEKGRQAYVFVLMPFAAEYKPVYEYVIKEAIEEVGYPSRRADDFFGPNAIMDDIERSIREARFLVADFSGRNPNVFYEVGLAHAIGRAPVLLTRSMEDVPPKLRVVRCIRYEDSLGGGERLREQLTQTIRSLQQTPAPPLYPQRVPNPDPNLCFVLAADPEGVGYQEIIKDTVAEADFTCLTAENLYSVANVLDEIWDFIQRAQLVIADLSGKDPDVFYLTGLCHGLNKNVILMAQDENDIPFDLRGRFRIVYQTDLRGGNASKERLKEVLSILREEWQRGIPAHNSANEDSDEEVETAVSDPVKLRQQIVKHFSKGELRLLLDDLGVHPDNVPGDTFNSYVAEAIDYFERRNSLPRLLTALRDQRPNIDWDV